MKCQLIRTAFQEKLAACKEILESSNLKSILQVIMAHMKLVENGKSLANNISRIRKLKLADSGSLLLDLVASQLKQKQIESIVLEKEFPTLLSENESRIDTEPILSDLKFGVERVKQEIVKQKPGDPCLKMFQEFASMAELEVTILQLQAETLENELTKTDSAFYEIFEVDVEDTLKTLKLILSSLHKMMKSESRSKKSEVPLEEGEMQDKSSRLILAERLAKHFNKQKSSATTQETNELARETLKGKRILEPELTPLRLTYNYYKDVCKDSRMVRTKTYKFLKDAKFVNISG